MAYLLVDGSGEVLAEFESLREVIWHRGPIDEIRRERGRLRLVRMDEYEGELVSATSFVTTTPLAQAWRERRDG